MAFGSLLCVIWISCLLLEGFGYPYVQDTSNLVADVEDDALTFDDQQAPDDSDSLSYDMSSASLKPVSYPSQQERPSSPGINAFPSTGSFAYYSPTTERTSRPINPQAAAAPGYGGYASGYGQSGQGSSSGHASEPLTYPTTGSGAFYSPTSRYGGNAGGYSQSGQGSSSGYTSEPLPYPSRVIASGGQKPVSYPSQQERPSSPGIYAFPSTGSSAYYSPTSRYGGSAGGQGPSGLGSSSGFTSQPLMYPSNEGAQFVGSAGKTKFQAKTPVSTQVVYTVSEPIAQPPSSYIIQSGNGYQRQKSVLSHMKYSPESPRVIAMVVEEPVVMQAAKGMKSPQSKKW